MSANAGALVTARIPNVARAAERRFIFVPFVGPAYRLQPPTTAAATG
jgi:hypothetical protein